MYILRFFVNAISSAVESIFCVCIRPGSDGGGGRETNNILGSEDTEGRGGYASLNTESSASEVLGLTSTYHSWFESKTAIKYACANLLAYMVVTIVGFSFVFEQWPIIDSMYFAVVLFTTVGYGDLSPSNDLSRAFVVPLAIYGIIILGIFLGVVGEFILARNDERIQQRLSNARVKVMEQFGKEDTAAPPERKSLLQEIVSIVAAEAPIILILGILGAPIVYLEGWDVIMGIYWMVITGTSVGFGDLGPSRFLTRCICIVWIPLSVAVLGEFLGRIASVYIDRNNDLMEERFLRQAMTLADLRRMDTNNDDKVSPNEFLQYMLVALQKVDKQDIDDIMTLFQKLDKNGSGFIDKEDLMSNYNLSVRPGVVVTASDLPSAPR